MNAEQVITFIRDQGIVLVSAKGPVPRLTEFIAGEAIKGSWWAHPKGREIFQLLQRISDSGDVLSCRLLNGHVTLVHSRLWPALVRLSCRFRPDQLEQIHQEHTPSGKHVNRTVAFPKWVPADVLQAGKVLSEQQARELLGPAAMAGRT